MKTQTENTIGAVPLLGVAHGSATLSEAANQALCWLMSKQAGRMKCGESRAAILEGFGPKVDEELQAFFCSPND